MKTDDSPYWVDVTLEDREMEDKVRTAIICCQVVHEWAMIEMRSLWTDSSERRVGYNELVVRMTKNLWKLGITKQVQRFSLVTALSRAVGRFNQEMVVDMVGSSRAEVDFADPRMPEEYKVLDVQSRSVWKQYMTEHSRFSTHYGGVYLDDSFNWSRILAQQIKKEGIHVDVMYYLVYSATLREKEGGWQAHFNFHKAQSMNGKKRIERDDRKRKGKEVHP